MPSKLKGKVNKTVIRPAMLLWPETWATTKKQEKRIEVTEIRMNVQSDTQRQDQKRTHARNESDAGFQKERAFDL